MLLSAALKTPWFGKFYPKCPVKEFSVFSWKIVSISPDSQEVIVKRVSDGKTKNYSFKEFGDNFIPENIYIQIIQKSGFIIDSKSDHSVLFKRASKS